MNLANEHEAMNIVNTMMNSPVSGNSALNLAHNVMDNQNDFNALEAVVNHGNAGSLNSTNNLGPLIQ